MDGFAAMEQRWRAQRCRHVLQDDYSNVDDLSARDPRGADIFAVIDGALRAKRCSYILQDDYANCDFVSENRSTDMNGFCMQDAVYRAQRCSYKLQDDYANSDEILKQDQGCGDEGLQLWNDHLRSKRGDRVLQDDYSNHDAVDSDLAEALYRARSGSNGFAMLAQHLAQKRSSFTLQDDYANIGYDENSSGVESEQPVAVEFTRRVSEYEEEEELVSYADAELAFATGDTDIRDPFAAIFQRRMMVKSCSATFDDETEQREPMTIGGSMAMHRVGILS